MTHNLSEQVTAFIGRADALNTITNLISQSRERLITIVGMGGIGKTRLSVAIGKKIVEQKHPVEDVFFVPLAPLTDAQHIVTAIANAIGITLSGAELPENHLSRHLNEKPTLLILDNFEHVMDGHLLLIELLSRCPSLYILVTSRERLNVVGEFVYNLKGMLLPDDLALSEATTYDAIQLFAQIAKRVDWNFRLSETNLQYVVDICQQVDGVPLAIELSAAWLRMISLDKINQHLSDSYDMLADSLAHVAPRHRSIRAVFESSWQLLTPIEQEIYAQLSIFRGGFTFDAVDEMWSATHQQMLSLIDKSLIYRNKDDRFMLHELLRQYAEEKLRQYPENLIAIQGHHARYYSNFLAEREIAFKVNGRFAPDALREIECELDNIRQMWYHALDTMTLDLVERAVEALYHFHRIRGSYHQSVTFLQDAIAVFDNPILQHNNPTLKIKLMAMLALSMQLIDQNDTALQVAETTYELAKQHNLPIEIARCELALSVHWTTIGELKRGQEFGELALQRYEHIEDIDEQTTNLMTLGWAYQLQGDFANAERIFNRLLIQSNTRGNIYQSAQGNIWLALLHNLQGKYLTAKNYALKALSQFESIGGRAYAIAVRKNVAVAYWGLGNYAEARRYFFDSLEVFVETQYRFIAGFLSTLAWVVHLMYSEGNLPNAVELGAFVLNHPNSNYETKEIVNKILPTIRNELDEFVFSTAEDYGKNATLSQMLVRLREYLNPSTKVTDESRVSPELNAVIQETLDTGAIPTTLKDETSREIASTIVKRVEEILETEKSRMMANFMTSASHDLRTPITIINSSLYLLERIQDPDRKQDKLNLVKDQVNHLHTVIEKLLLMSRLDSGAKFDFYKVDIVPLLRAIFVQTQPRAHECQVVLQLDVPDKRLEINADISFLQDAIIHVLDNALDNTQPDEQIIIRCQSDETHVMIQIEDTGIGIQAEHLNRVFDRFYRLDTARQARGKAGLGLSIVKRIIETHNGYCLIESMPQRGTTLTMMLPLV